MQIFDEREYHLLHDGIHLLRREIMKNRPLELRSINNPVPNLNLSGKYAFIGEPQHGAFFSVQIIAVIQVMNEHKVCHLLNDIQRIGKSSRPEDFP